jgi:hypothetical protein
MLQPFDRVNRWAGARPTKQKYKRGTKTAQEQKHLLPIPEYAGLMYTPLGGFHGKKALSAEAS